MNCGNLGEGCGRRDFPGDPYNIYCLTSIEFLNQSVQQSNQIMSEQRHKYIYTAHGQTNSISDESMQLMQLF